MTMNNRFSLPNWVREANTISSIPWDNRTNDFKSDLKKRLKRFCVKDPLVTIAIIAWNEEINIVRTLSTLANQQIDMPTEILVVDNNSSDRTRQVCRDLGVRVVEERRQGIAHARLCGLVKSRGIFHLCCDADTLYPPQWATTLIEVLKQPGVTLSYGNYSFIPDEQNSRLVLGLYELIAETVTELRKIRREYLNVRGPNFAFYKKDGIAVRGFELKHTRRLGDRSVVFGEDGKMARKLGEVGKLKRVRSYRSRVYTSHRQLVAEGSLMKVFFKHARREAARIVEYLFGFRKPIPTSDQL
jgi:glycosyltransferase involved in cell wall biosynthesis